MIWSACYLVACKHLMMRLIFTCSGSVAADAVNDNSERWSRSVVLPPRRHLRRSDASVFHCKLLCNKHTWNAVNTHPTQHTFAPPPAHHSQIRTQSVLCTRHGRSGRSEFPAPHGRSPPPAPSRRPRPTLPTRLLRPRPARKARPARVAKIHPLNLF